MRRGRRRDLIGVGNQSHQFVVSHQIMTLQPLAESADEKVFVRLLARDDRIMPGVGGECLQLSGEHVGCDVRGAQRGGVSDGVLHHTAVDGTGVDGRRHDTADALVIGMVVAGEVGEPGFVCDHRRRAIGDYEFGDRAAQQFNRVRLSGVERAQCRQLSCHQLRKALPARGRVADAAQAAVGEAQE
jgi:hypothetical protein